MFQCEKYRIEVLKNRSYSFYVTVRPVEYLGKAEFKKWIQLCKRSFMTLTSRRPWIWTRVFNNRNDAASFARHLTQELGEVVFLNVDTIQIVTPREDQEKSLFQTQEPRTEGKA